MSINISIIADDLVRSISNKADDQLTKIESTREAGILAVESGLRSSMGFTQDGVWRHIAPLSANDQLPNGRMVQHLNISASHYFSQDVVRNPELDWFYVDALIAYSNKEMVVLGESLTGDQFAGLLTHGIKMILDGKYGMGILLVASKLMKFLFIAIAIFVPLFAAENGQIQFAAISLGAIGYVLLSMHGKAGEYSIVKNRMFERIWDANRVYSLTAEKSDIKWDLLESELNDTRRRGIPWLSALNIAVKETLHNSPTCVLPVSQG